MRSHMSWRGEGNIFYKGVETSPYMTRFKNVERKSKRESSKMTISASMGLSITNGIRAKHRAVCPEGG